jgi:hypothetical protein
VSAVFILSISLVPGWYAHIAANAGLAPTWIYLFIIALVFAAGLVALDFFKKGFGGVAPSRTRRRS